MTVNRSKTSVNRQVLLGELGADAESRAMASGEAVVNLRVVTYSEYRDRATNDLREVAETHRVSVFGKPAEELRGLTKGQIVYVEGRTRTRKVQTQGAAEARYFAEVLVSAFEGKCLMVSGTGIAANDRNEAGKTQLGVATGEEQLDDRPPY